MRALVTGGARSGKSGFAERYSATLAEKGMYIATCQPYDKEMEARIALHREQRERSGYAWRTVEEPYSLSEFLSSGAAEPGEVILVDCLTLWLTNWLLRWEQEADAEARVEEKIRELVETFRSCRADVVMVTNEVGYGLVPEYRLGRQFRDLSGRMNQRLAEAADQVFLVTAGIPVELKSKAYIL
ncbi:bifunctional adenosylcobinamide kinase/adenosylcobinamide-phosphate guanylyltransferase [Paenibacillus sp. GD4]|jgi:adenosylcobinamide kinase / adenosylcobinamide-phosphate guanylyltransferase|uniref:bifunctional adenosylcobinamide kinase/adenosylcobinamide-phosphate guanylyltransferase n=1 Tax=Paenibacillus TaxID=44249 RepID=UPI0025433585|nr:MULTISPECIES: bifunctional adenosylcobinamide kinase/adenosylcobinamide-phosphate guanylyltransferase [Paenibacillus]MDQ1910205.1 bifunctional adenosylcobinamide kinase/adenosylcobinamide-phosphate guanylyltransferase [Paenibacillus sp. GD4]